MNRLLAFLALAALIPVSMAEFPRPWENESWIAENPNIWSFGKAYWWNIGEFQKTLDSADFTSVSRIPLEDPAAGHISDAMKSAGEAEIHLSRCHADLILSLGYLPSFPSLAIISIFSESSACMAYSSDWRLSVDSDLLAIEDSIDASEKAVSEARAAYARMKYLGLCGTEYSGPGSEDCTMIESAFLSVDGGIAEGDYGKYVLIRQYSSTLESDLLNESPDLGESPTILGLVWGNDGVVKSFRNLRSSAQTSCQEAEKFRSEVAGSAAARKSSAASQLKALDSADAGKISRGPSGIGLENAGSIAERYSYLAVEIERLNALLLESRLQYSRTLDRGYLAKSISLAESSEQGFSELTREAELLRTEARYAVDEQREEAASEISKTEKAFRSVPPGKEAMELLDEAKTSYLSAESANTLGTGFERYSKAAALARAARNADSFAAEQNADVSVALLKSLIQRAEKDGINVVSEKENLELLALLSPSQASEAVQSSIDSIVAKARAKYENNLLERRLRISDKISLAGPAAADLYTDMVRFEEGLVENGVLIFPDSIGSLKKLDSDYANLEAVLEDYSSDTVGNSMSVSTNPIVPLAKLDEPSEIILDVVMPNPRPYEAAHVNAQIRMGDPFDFLFSEITRGQEGIDSIRSLEGGKTIAVIFTSVAPYETKRVTFVKKSIIAHTLERTIQAQGLGNGRAGVRERIEFNLDCSVSGLDAPEGMESALLDGSASNGIIPPGKHFLSSDRIMEDAYSESVENIRAYRIGTNSLIEYDVRVMPAIDMESARVFLTSINDSRISSFDVTCATGETVKEKARITDTGYSALVMGLRKNKETVLKVRYRVEDTESFVRERLSSIEGLDLGPSANTLIQQAKSQASSGNFTEALALLEQAVATAKEEEKANVKLRSQCDSIEKNLREELSEIQSALGRYNSSSPFMLKLISRKNELERALSESNASNLSGKMDKLQNIDGKWLEKEITSLKKELYSRYNDIRERFYSSGNVTTPAEFLAFEEAYRRLEAGARLEYGVEAIQQLDYAENVVASQEELSETKKVGMRGLFDNMKRETLDTLGGYLRQAAAAKGTDYSSIFVESEKKVNSIISETEDAIGADSRIFQSRLEELNRSRERMEAALDSLKNESEARMSMLESILASRKIATERKAELEAKLESIRKMAEVGDYVNALRAQSALAKELDSMEEPEGNGMLILGVTGIALLAGIGFYMAKNPKEKKEPRRLTSFSDPNPQIQSKPSSKASQGQRDRSSRSLPSPSHPPSSQPGDSTQAIH
ncbi:MAG: hypothetical protein V1861_04620 [Candidatus Micrarchaeota archaeon]